MSRFLFKILLGTVIVCIIILAMNAVYVEMNKGDRYNTKKFSEIPARIQIANIGSSHGENGFAYDDLEEFHCFNFALSSQRLSYDIRIVENFKENFDDGCVLFIPISYFSLYGKDEVDFADFRSKNKRYYTFLDKQYIKEYNFFDDLCVHRLPVLSAGLDMVRVFLGKSQDVWDEEWSKKIEDEASLLKSAQNASGRHFDPEEYGGEINENEVAALYDIISFCKENDIIPVMITTPYLKEYTELVSDQFYTEFYSKIEEVQERTGTAYFDYAKDVRFQNEWKLFRDADHLNKEGAIYFTNILKKEVVDTIK